MLKKQKLAKPQDRETPPIKLVWVLKSFQFYMLHFTLNSHKIICREYKKKSFNVN